VSLVLVLAIVVIGAAIVFDFTNGWNDSANAIATVVSTRVLSPFAAVALAAVLNFAGALSGQEVAKTISREILDPEALRAAGEVTGLLVLLSSLLAAAVWITIATRAGMPISGSHSLLGGMVGAGLALGGASTLEGDGIRKVLLSLLFSPVFGLLFGFMIMGAVQWTFRKVNSHRVNVLFGKLQILSCSWMAFEHGGNDAQKAMGAIVAALVAAGFQDDFHVPLWVIIACGAAMAAGTAAGGWKVIKTVGLGLLKLKPVHGFAAETAASAVLMVAKTQGLPVSTTHTITTSIMGVGATQRLSAVRWGIGKKIVVAWIVTLPATIGIAYVLQKMMMLIS
jgi:PiT family inorganic phosphate transporter